MWKSLMKDCAFYFDTPSINQENKMKSKLQLKYDGMLSAGWRPPLQSRRDLVTWACTQLNANFEEKGWEKDNLMDCENYKGLINAFGPDYNKLKPKLGYVRGLFD